MAKFSVGQTVVLLEDAKINNTIVGYKDQEVTISDHSILIDLYQVESFGGQKFWRSPSEIGIIESQKQYFAGDKVRIVVTIENFGNIISEPGEIVNVITHHLDTNILVVTGKWKGVGRDNEFALYKGEYEDIESQPTPHNIESLVCNCPWDHFDDSLNLIHRSECTYKEDYKRLRDDSSL